MNVTLVHPAHGAKIAIHEQEMTQDLKNGWSVMTHVDSVVNDPLVKGNVAPKIKKSKGGDGIPPFLTSAG